MAGASTAAVQRILRHADPRTTTEVYGHLVPGFLRDEVNRLSFGAPLTESQAVAGASTQLVTTLLQGPAEGGSEGDEGDHRSPRNLGGSCCTARQDSNLRPVG